MQSRQKGGRLHSEVMRGCARGGRAARGCGPHKAAAVPTPIFFSGRAIHVGGWGGAGCKAGRRAGGCILAPARRCAPQGTAPGRCACKPRRSQRRGTRFAVAVRRHERRGAVSGELQSLHEVIR